MKTTKALLGLGVIALAWGIGGPEEDPARFGPLVLSGFALCSAAFVALYYSTSIVRGRNRETMRG